MRGETFRRIVADQRLGVSVLVTFAVLSAACPSTRAVNTSQRILLETGRVTGDVYGSVERAMPTAQDRAREAVMREVNAARSARQACVDAGTNPDECVEVPTEEQAISMYDAALDDWNRLVAALVAFHGVLTAWQQINDEWRASGERPTSWARLVCEPLGTLSTTILELLVDVGVEVDEPWQTVIGLVDEVCTLGVGVVGVVASGQEGEGR